MGGGAGMNILLNFYRYVLNLPFRKFRYTRFIPNLPMAVITALWDPLTTPFGSESGILSLNVVALFRSIKTELLYSFFTPSG